MITGLILREFDRRGTISIRDFYARRAKRLLPLSAFVLAFIGLMSLLVFGPVRQVEVGGDIFPAALYFVNWHFIGENVDYFASEEGLLSPVQHYWSLSVEEQFYVLWPLLLLMIGSLALRGRRRFRTAMLVVLTPLALASLAYSVHYTGVDPQRAYFSTLTRGWELAFGGILALFLPRAIRLPRLASTMLVAGGIAAITVAAILLKETDPYPGWRAIFPVAGTIMVIVGGSAVARGLAVRFLSVRPLQYLGKISYAWYLWHWPFVVFAIAIWGELSPEWLVIVTLAAWIPSEISHRLIEEPFRRSRYLGLRPNRALAIGAVCTLATVAIGLGINVNRLQIDSATEVEVAGATVVVDGFQPQDRAKKIKPTPLKARDDRGRMYDEGCLVQGDATDSGECEFGRKEAKDTVVLFGDSHALQYFPAMERIADEKEWKLVGLSRGNCLIADVRYRVKCDEWRENALERIERVRPELVVVSSSTLDRFRVKVAGDELSRGDSQPYLVDGLTRVLERLKRTGAKVTVIRDQARAPLIPAECVAEHPDRLRRCDFEPARRDEWAFDRDAAKRAGVRLIDPMPILCKDGRCPVVIGDALVYRDTYHLTATFARTLAPWLEKRLPSFG